MSCRIIYIWLCAAWRAVFVLVWLIVFVDERERERERERDSAVAFYSHLTYAYVEQLDMPIICVFNKYQNNIAYI